MKRKMQPAVVHKQVDPRSLFGGNTKRNEPEDRPRRAPSNKGKAGKRLDGKQI